MATALPSSICITAIILSTACGVLGKAEVFRFESHLRENSACDENHCINPVFPAFEELTRNEDHRKQLQCHPASTARAHAKFCEAALNYDVAIPAGNFSNLTDSDLARLIGDRDASAATSYFYHLSGMQLDAWEHQHPEDGTDDCVAAVWRMACHTFFPRAEAGCAKGGSSAHLRPCKNVCMRYVEACQVRCCDNSVQCAPPTHGTDDDSQDVNVRLRRSTLVEDVNGKAGPYANEFGPSFHCTGTAVRGAGARVAAAIIGAQFLMLGANFPGGERLQRQGFVASTLLMLSVALQGCDGGSGSASWQAKPKYAADFHVKPSGNNDEEPTLNSCAAKANSAGHPVCSGNGECKEWRAGGGNSEPISFCDCNRDWADPECRTRRMSQAKAFKLSLFGGFFGLDSFYLGHHALGAAKLATFGGMGAWWAFDVIRIGSAPIRTANYRLAADLEPWVFVTYSMLTAAFIGFFAFLVLECRLRRKRAAGMSSAVLDEALKTLPVPAVGYGTLKPSDPNIKCLASVPPSVPQTEAPVVPVVEPLVKVLETKAPENKASEATAPETKVEAQAPAVLSKVPSPKPSAPSLSDAGLTAPLSEMGYGTVAALRSKEQMKIYMKRVVEHLGGRIKDEDCDELSHLVSEYSGVDFVRSFRRMIDALRRAPCVTYEKTAASTTAADSVGDTTFFLSCCGGEGAILMNKDGRPAVANVDLILKGLKKEAMASDEKKEEEVEESEHEEEKLAQVQSPGVSFKTDDAAKRLGLVLPPLDFDDSSPRAIPEGRTLESLLLPEDLVVTFIVPETFDGQVGLVPGARPPQRCFVKAIVPGSWADTSGVRVDDEILAVNGISVSELDRASFHKEMQKRPLQLSIRTQAPPLIDDVHEDCPTPGRVRELVELLNQNEGSVQSSPQNSRQGSTAVAPPAA